ncbi:restriction endonuclease subunit S [Prevotella melaninogenica]|uniref:restriction endonuclease subunit S n=1 Tax=Prevotella melaninogenica TaxID=28132 RepID=UPI001BA94223|nr:restriction endonuclease subunit S [Prevotella melaninogenica]QUB60000.1 restriction endonuclease subunit S [Prevotella melaninogenica]
METIRFDDFIRLNRGFDLPDYKIEKGEYPVITSTNIKAFHKEYKVEGPMVVTGRSGSLGKVQYIEGRCWPLNTSLYVKDYKGNFPRYVYYFLQMMHLEQYNTGAGVPTLNQNHLHSLKIKIHEKKLQQKIASILSSYDRLIENNTRRIRLLEQMAENLYKEWFVRFRFPKHENVEMVNGLPKGWKRIKLIKNIKTSSGGTPSRNKGEYYKNGTIPWIKTGELQDCILINTEECITEDAVNNSSAKLFPKGTLLMAMYGVNVGKLGISEIEATCNQACCVFTPKHIDYKYYLFHYLKSIREYLLSISFGAAQQNLSQELIKSIRVLFPDEETNISFVKKVQPLFKEISIIQQQNQLLTRQRDLLLPRLMSGKLEVKS